MNIDERYRAAEDEAQLEYIKQWRERKRKKKDRRKDYWMETVWHLRMFFDNYKVVDGKWKYNPNMILPGHGEKSIIMLQNIAPDALTNEEIACIRWHMGAFDDRNNWEYYTRAVAKFPNVMYTHAADMAAAYIVGV